MKVEWDISIFAIIFGEFRIISKRKGENQGEEAEGKGPESGREKGCWGRWANLGRHVVCDAELKVL